MTLIFHPEPSASAVLNISILALSLCEHGLTDPLAAGFHRARLRRVFPGAPELNVAVCDPHQKRQKLLSTRLRGEYATVLFLTDTETSRVKQHRADRAGPKSDTETSIKNPVDFQNKTPNANFQS